MKSALIYVLSFLLFPSLAFAALVSHLSSALGAGFERDLYFGLRDNPEVTKLQEFLRDQGIYSGPVTGGFFSLTRDAVKNFQKREGIEPPLGFFGPLTRAKANKLLESTATKTKEEVVADITRQIAELQKQLQGLQTKQATEAEKPKESPPTAPVPVVETPVKPSKLIVSGSATSTFPEVDAVTFKMGEFTLDNNTTADILVSNFRTLLSDEMDSTPNRNRKVFFLVRDGPGISDTLVSTTDFTFVLSSPKAGEPYKVFMDLPYSKVIKAGEKKTLSIWIEQMKFVKSGTLKLESTKTFITSEAEIEGNFNLVLTKEPPL